jgi:predicted nucleotidyltransferase
MTMHITEKIVDKIYHILNPMESIDYAFLFGSALRKLLPQSDIDILIGGEMDFDQKMLLTAGLSKELSRKVDLVLVKEARSELVLKAMSRGIPVLIKNKNILKRDYMNNLRLFDDTTGLRQMRFARIKREYANG